MSKRFRKLARVRLRSVVAGQSVAEHGITFTRLTNGDGVYRVNVMVDGRRIHRVIGKESEGVTRTQAEEFIEQARTEARQGRLNLPKARKTVFRFAEAAALYLARLSEEGGKDLQAKGWRLRLHLVPFFRDMPISAITGSDIERYKQHRLGETAKPGTVNRELAALSHLLNKAIQWGWLTLRPAKVERLREGHGRIVYLTAEQAERLREAARADANPQTLAFVMIGLETGMRRMEILSIRREHVNLDRRVIFVTKAKAGEREQPITSSLAGFLGHYMSECLPSGTPWLFPSQTSKTGHTTDVRKAFRRAVVAAGMNPEEVVRHTLRHTAITHLVQAGIDLPTVKRISGHKTLLMVERYAHQNGKHILAAMNALESRYAAVRGLGQSGRTDTAEKVQAGSE